MSYGRTQDGIVKSETMYQIFQQLVIVVVRGAVQITCVPYVTVDLDLILMPV